MSNAIRYDPLLVHHLARELDARLAGRACAVAPRFAPDRSATLAFEGAAALRFDLHPLRGWIRIVERDAAALGEEMAGVCTGVRAPADERLLCVEIEGAHRFRGAARRLVVELHTNQWNALLVDAAEDRIVTVLRGRDAGGRALRPGAAYAPPPGGARFGAVDVERAAALAEWRRVLGDAPPADRASTLVRRFAWTGTLSAAALLGRAAGDGADDDDALREAFERWWAMRPPAPAAPVVLRARHGAQPYPFALPGLAAEPTASLLEAMARAASDQATAPTRDAPEEAQLLEQARAHAARLARRAERLRARLGDGAEAERMRLYGDLLLAHLARVPRGAGSVRLPGWEDGAGEVEIALDPALSPAENAAAWYERARRQQRAAARLPALLEAAEREAERWAAALRDAEAGAPLAPWVARALASRPHTAGAAAGARSEAAEALPYRVYRTSGGLEVRVGRSARDNDRLTFRHAAPNDVWLHARSVPGSHVVLRWRDAEGAPPARDLSEAASLAALFSRARTSSLVPVDWTRRKHVRKPRGAPAGTVVPQRVKTLFVEPDAALEERLRAGPSDASGAA